MDSFPNKGRFKDLLAKISVGIEMEEWTLEEYGPLKAELEQILNQDGLLHHGKTAFSIMGIQVMRGFIKGSAGRRG